LTCILPADAERDELTTILNNLPAEGDFTKKHFANPYFFKVSHHGDSKGLFGKDAETANPKDEPNYGGYGPLFKPKYAVASLAPWGRSSRGSTHHHPNISSGGGLPEYRSHKHP